MVTYAQLSQCYNVILNAMHYITTIPMTATFSKLVQCHSDKIMVKILYYYVSWGTF